MWAVVDLPQPARVIFNQAFAPGWRSSHGSVVEDAGRTAVDASAGQYRLHLKYRPPEMAVAVVLTLFGLALTILTARLATRGRVATFMRREGRTRRF